jgi:hypothetical protein
MKALSTPLKILMVIVILLVVAVIVLSIFTGGIQNVAGTITSWFEGLFGGGGEIRTCESAGGSCEPPGTECDKGMLINVCTQPGYICCKN